jgi:hypothetical protein
MKGTKQMKSFRGALTVQIGVALAFIALARVSNAQSIETFDAPGATDTYPQAINELGRMTGYFSDSSRRYHAFVRSPFGTLSTFDAPNAASDGQSTGTFAVAINALGQIVGTVYGLDGENLSARGFVRSPNGAITEFDAAADALRTEPQAINVFGWIGGKYLDLGFKEHAFVRSPNGTVTTFDAPDFFTWGVRQILPNGAVIGVSSTTAGLFRGFIRASNGSLSSFDAPDVSPTVGGVFCGKCWGTFSTAASPTGRIVGYYGASSGVIRSFLREPDGTFSPFDVLGAISTRAEAINLEGAIAGEYATSGPYAVHGFLRTREGPIDAFDTPNPNDLYVTGISPLNKVIGHYFDSGSRHGFIRSPRAACSLAHF